MIYQSEKSIADLGDKLDAADKGELETKINALKEALKGSSVEDIKAKQEDLQKKFYEVSSKVYSEAGAQQAPQGEPQPGAQSNGAADDGYVDADYKDVDDSQK